MPTDRASVEMTTDDGASSITKLAAACNRGADIFSYRLVQLVVVSIYLALIIHAVLNKGWWLYVDASLAFGFTASVVAYFAIGFTTFRNFAHYDGGVFDWKIACLIDTIPFILYGITFIAMCMPKGKDYKHLFEEPPYKTWYFAAFFSLFACVSYGASAYRIARDK